MTNNDQHQYSDRYMLRLPDGMRDRIKATAADNNHSMNAEIVATLEEKYPAPTPKQEILQRAALAAHMIRQLYNTDELSLEDSNASVAPILYHLKQNGFEGTAHELHSVELSEALALKIDFEEFFGWMEAVNKEFEDHFPAATFLRGKSYFAPDMTITTPEGTTEVEVKSSPQGLEEAIDQAIRDAGISITEDQAEAMAESIAKRLADEELEFYAPERENDMR